MNNYTRKNQFILLGLFALTTSFVTLSLWAHGGEDHGDAKVDSTASQGSPPILSKESQFILGVHTDIAIERVLPDMLTVQGFVIPTASGKAEIYSPIPGKIIATRSFTIGQSVKKGELLLSVQQVITGTERLALEQELANVQKEYDEASKDLARKVLLKDFVATQDLEQAQIREIASKKRIESIKGGLLNGTKKVTVVSPINGVVSFSDFVNGEITDVTKRLVEIVNVSTVWVSAQIPEEDILRTQTSKSATIHAPTSSTPLSSIIVSKGDVIDPDSRTLTYIYEVKKNSHSLKINGSATVAIDMSNPQSVISIPRSAVLTQNGRTFTIVHSGPEQFTPVEIILGMHGDGDNIQVVKGISSGDRIVINNLILFKQYLP